jgi:hypothetical protein
MHLNAVETYKIQTSSETPAAKPLAGTELEQMVGVGLLGDLNGQLADISARMNRQIEEKQELRGEIDSIVALRQGREPLEINGQQYRDLSPQEAELLGVTQEAVPQTDESGAVTGYRLAEDLFQGAVAEAIHRREQGLASLNGDGELVMLKIQSLIDQRKNALTLLSNLMAASNEVAKTIINNIRS